jgi:hypothetical protein
MNFLFRILGILDDTVNVVVVPVDKWHLIIDERDRLRAEVERLRRLVREGV